MEPIKWSVGMACACLMFWGFCTVARSQRADTPAEPVPQADAKKSAWLHDVYLKDAAEYDFYLDAEQRKRLTLRPEPVMRWTSGGDYRGELYVWTSQGRPEIIGCIFSSPGGRQNRRVTHEFHSLATQPLVAAERGGSGWEPHEAGLELQPIPDAPEPGPTPVRRLGEMRELARRFSVQMTARDRTWDLRLLPQPIYRYETTDPGGPVVDGAVFALVWTVGTDPEVLLVLEAHRTDRALRWEFALARFTNREVWANYRNREVWRVGTATYGGATNQRYGAFSVKTIPDPTDAR